MASRRRPPQHRPASADKFSRELWQAAVSKDANLVHKLIQRHANMKVVSENGYDYCTPLHWAAGEGNMDIVRLLLKSGANINARTSETGLTPLHQAAISGHSETIEFLLLNGAVIEAKDKKDGQTALHLAASQGHRNAVEILIENGADVGAKDTETKSTPLHAAAANGQTESAHLLLQYEADINAQNKSGNTALHSAAWFGHPDVVHLFISYEAKLNIENKFGRIPVETARESTQYRGKSKTLRAEIIKMLESADKILKLHEATMKGDVSGVKEFSTDIKEGINVMVEVDYDNTSEGDKCSPIHEAAERGDAAVIQVLLDNGADVNIKTPEWGYTALHRAAQYAHNEALDVLLRNNADTEARDFKHGVTALHLAAVADHTETVDLLYKHDAFLDAQDKLGYSPLHRAAGNGHIRTVKLLLKHGADVEVINSIHEHTPLHVAIIHNHEEVAEELIKYHARIDAQNLDGNTILHLAAAHGCCNFAEKLVLDIFPNHIRYTDIKNKDGDTPLHLAAMFGYVKILRLLVLYGCQLDVRNNDGATARKLVRASPQYKNKTERSQALKIIDAATTAQPEILTAAFLVVAEKYHKKWITLAKRLDILNFQIKMISEKNPEDTKKQCYEMLVLWSLKNFYDNDLFQKLLRILRSWRCQKLVNQVIVKYHERMHTVFKKHKV
ncbi:serine/threonine-protein phosphatase 6 regulatory ankyrin repeat subunit B-like isoform X2 [Ptychodera flava]|uniref:serine/threonine-protein phosphatase 6 regulatory ankyrin repeat subunit B-like isoform X2 n=1 Tax=Ptychodera flava TaxID=63121 RepID=UPI00396A6A97